MWNVRVIAIEIMARYIDSLSHERKSCTREIVLVWLFFIFFIFLIFFQTKKQSGSILRSFAQWSLASEVEFSKRRGETNGLVNMGDSSSNLPE